MKKESLNAKGFGLIAVVIVIVVLVVLGGAGVYVYHQDHEAKKNANNTASVNDSNPTQGKSQASSTNSNSKPDPYAGWKTYTSSAMMLNFMYPSNWTVNKEEPSAPNCTMVTTRPVSTTTGDPTVTFTSCPSSSSISSQNVGTSDSKVQTFTTGEGVSLTLVGTINQPLGPSGQTATKPTSMYATSCWDRNCWPQLKNGRFVAMTIGAINDSPGCQPHVSCYAEISTSGQNFSDAVDILSSVKSN